MEFKQGVIFEKIYVNNNPADIGASTMQEIAVCLTPKNV